MRKVVKASDASANSTQTPASDPELQVNVAPNQSTMFWLVANILFDTSGSVRFKFVGPAGASGVIDWRLWGAGAIPLGAITLGTQQDSTGDSSATVGQLIAWGLFQTGSTGGAFAFQTARFGAGSTQVKAGSIIISA